MHQLPELKLPPAALRIEAAFDPAGPSQGLHRKESFIRMHSEMARRLRRLCYSNGGSVKEGWDRLWFLPEMQLLERERLVCLCLGVWSPLLVVEGKVTVPCVPLVVYKDQNL